MIIYLINNTFFYQQEIEECTYLIMQTLDRANPHTLAYQSRVGPVEWLQPYTEDALKELGAKGVKDLVVVPISFVSEHIETLQEIDIEYREIAEEAGIHNFGRVPAPNTNPVFTLVDFHTPTNPIFWPGLAVFFWLFETETAWELLKTDLPGLLRENGFDVQSPILYAGGSLQVIQGRKMVENG